MDERSVVTCFLEAGGQVLLVRRSARVSTYRGRWSGISGTIESGHAPEEQALQEIREETRLSAPAVALTARGEPITFVDADLQRRWTVYPFRCAISAREQVQLDWENTEGRWVAPAFLDTYNTVPHLREAWEQVGPAGTLWLPAEVARGVREVREDSAHGASELARRALMVLEEAAVGVPADSAGALRARLEAVAGELAAARPTMVPLAYWASRFAGRLAGLDEPEAGAARRAAAGLAATLQAEMRAGIDAVVEQAAGLLGGQSQIATASYSSLVLAVLLRVRPRQITALASVGPDGRAAGEALVERLAHAGLDAALAPDAEVERVGREAGVVLIGADAVWPDGSVVNGTPSRALAAAARAAGRAAYALADRARLLTATLEPGEPGFEVVPAGMLTGIIGEEGLVVHAHR